MKIKFGNITIKKDRPFLILEAGVNHEGCLDTAFEMIDAAAETGADAIKFQSYKAETLAIKNSPAYWDTNKEAAKSQYELFKRFDSFGDREYEKLSERCEQKGIIFLSTPFDDHFVDILAPLVPFFKIASADLTNIFLLEKIALQRKPVILSTGASYLSEIEEAVRFLKKLKINDIALLHCVLEYPTSPMNANLRSVSYLKTVFPECVVGYSDHVPPNNNCQALLIAWLQGAIILEKHFTLDKGLIGNDHYHAMDPDDVLNFRKNQQEVALMLGRECTTCLPCEEPARIHARRSLVTKKNILAGECILKDDLTAKRPGNGLTPKRYNDIVGRISKADIAKDSLITINDVD